MLKIWGRQTSSNVQKVLWTCKELDIDYDRIDMGGPFGGLDDPSYRALNPNGLIPTIDDGGFVLWESHAIIRYLANDDPRLMPSVKDRTTRALIDQWMYWALIPLGWSLRSLFMLSANLKGQEKPQELDHAQSHTARLFSILDQRLQASPFVAGKQFSLADIPCGVSAHRWLNIPLIKPAFPALEAWYASIKNRPAFAAIAASPPR